VRIARESSTLQRGDARACRLTSMLRQDMAFRCAHKEMRRARGGGAEAEPLSTAAAKDNLEDALAEACSALTGPAAAVEQMLEEAPPASGGSR